MYHLSDALRKRHSRSVMSTNVEQNFMRLKEQALKKSIYRQRKKMEKASLEVSVRESSQVTSDFEEAGPTFQSSSNPEKTEPYLSPSTPFRHKATKTRSLKKSFNKKRGRQGACIKFSENKVHQEKQTLVRIKRTGRISSGVVDWVLRSGRHLSTNTRKK